MKITVLGTGYVGLVLGTCLSELGNEVICADIAEDKIKKLNEGEIPIYEPGLKELVLRNSKEKRLSFTTDIAEAIKKGEVIFLAIGTPPKEDGDANLAYMFEAAKTVGDNIKEHKVIVTKSTVPPGTNHKIREIIAERTDCEFDIVSNPEFLREGAAVKDFMNPDRIIIGCDSERAEKMMRKLYSPVERTTQPIIVTDILSAEITKYACNAMLASRISFVNEISLLCDKVGANIKDITKGMGLDKRIGSRFLNAGVGYGGSCFPKDVKALASTLKKQGIDPLLISAIDEVNEKQKKTLLPKLKKHLGSLAGKKIAVWGLSFKPKTDDVRESPAITLINQLLEEGSEVVAFDPVGAENFKRMMPEISYSEYPYDACEDADALVLLTEWDEFRILNYQKLKEIMKSRLLVDGRNIWNPSEARQEGFEYEGIGR